MPTPALYRRVARAFRGRTLYLWVFVVIGGAMAILVSPEAWLLVWVGWWLIMVSYWFRPDSKELRPFIRNRSLLRQVAWLASLFLNIWLVVAIASVLWL